MLYPFVSNFINTLSARQSERVHSIMADVHVGKSEIQRVIDRLENQDDFAPTQLINHNSNTRISSRRFLRNVSDITDDVEELYEILRLVSILLVSQSNELSSRIEAAEREIDSMEKLIDLYSFMLADNKRFDEAYIETFHDNRGRGDTIRVPDRAGIDFTTTSFGDIRVDEGVFVIPEKDDDSYPLAINIIKTNAAAFGHSSTNDLSMLVDGSERGWKYDIATPNRVDAPLQDDPWGHSGAQLLLECVLPDPVPMSEIRLKPNTDTPTEEILSIKLYESLQSDENPVEVVHEPTSLYRVQSFHFAPQSVERFRVLINQPVHDQQRQHRFGIEDSYRSFIDNFVNTSDVFVSWFGMPYSYDELSHITHSEDQFVQFSKEDFDAVVLDTLYHIDPQVWQESFADIQSISSMMGNENDNAVPAPQLIDPAVQRFRPIEHKYHYSIGLKRVVASIEALTNKAAFVTEAIPSFGDIGVVQLKADYKNQLRTGVNTDTNQISSVEFSVSNASNPFNEQDWIPIQPVDDNVISGERLFLDKDGVAELRFKADPDDNVVVYRQGYIIDENLVAFLYEGPWIMGVQIHTGTISQEEVFACDYVPALDNKTIDFKYSGADDPAIAYAYSNNGPGEYFERTNNQRRVKLSHHPFTNIRSDLGDPIVAQLESGEFAEDKTGGSLDPTEDLSFLASGRDIIFNRSIDEPFRVFYYHVENNVRVRAVLRGNGREFSSPKLYSFQLKGKVQLPESNSDNGDGGGSTDATIITGTLTGSAQLEGIGCVWLEASDGSYEVRWPEGWQINFSPLQLSNPNGEVVAVAGDDVRVAGTVISNVFTVCQVGTVFDADRVTIP